MASPAVVQSTGSTYDPTSYPDFIFNLLHPTLSGNGIVVLVEYSGTHTFTVTTDTGDTLSEVTGAAETAGAQNQKVYYKQTATVGTVKITVTPNSSTIYMRVQALEVTDVSTVNTSGHGNGSSAVASTNITTTLSGCLILHFTTQGSVDGYFATSAFSVTGTGTLELTSLWDGNASQAIVQSGSGSITPGINYPSSVAWSSSVIALNAVSAGTPMPTDVIRVRKRLFHSALHFGGSNDNMAADMTTARVQFPRQDGALVVHSIHAWSNNLQNHSVSSVTDLGGQNFYQAAATTSFISGQRADVSIWASINAQAITPMDTLVFANACSEVTCCSYEVRIPAGFSPRLGKTGGWAQTSATSPFTVKNLDGTNFQFTPTQAGSLLIVNLPVENSTVDSSTSPSTGAFDGFFSTAMNGGFNRVEEDNGHAHYVAPSLSAQTWTFTVTNLTATGPGNYGVTFAEFYAVYPGPGVVTSPSIQQRMG